MIDVIWEEFIERMNKEMYLVINSELDLQLKGKECKIVDVGIVIDFVLLEFVEMENKFFNLKR